MGRLAVMAIAGGILLCATVVGMLLHRVERRHSRAQDIAPVESVSPPTATQPLTAVRDIPAAFPRNTHLPTRREMDVSGSVDPERFSPGRDLVYVDDSRVWWESDHDTGDDECDHSVHRALDLPLRRLIALVATRNGTLEVHDAYRPTKIHNSRSLHKEGRAIDVTCDELGLEELAKLCWAAGFDWVYHESPARGGAHIHASVRTDHADTEEELATR